MTEPETEEEAAERDAALALLPQGVDLSNVDSEKFAGVTAYAVVVRMPDGLGLAGVGLTAADAWRALAERQRGQLAASAVWFPPVHG